MFIIDLLRKNALLKRVLSSRFYLYLRSRKKINAVVNSMGLCDVFSKRILLDVLDERRLNQVPYDEYFLFDFMNLSNDERRKFVSDIERVKIAELLNDAKNDLIFYDKNITYSYYKDFYFRDVVCISSFNDSEFSDFVRFFEKHDSFICKPVDGGCGTGIQIFHANNITVAEMFEILKRQYNRSIIVEELIVQNGVLHDLHPCSVNTVRMPTIRFDDRVEVIHPFLRVGKGDSVTDNAGSGGIICALDTDTGTVIATSDEFGNSYETHPDSGIKLIGLTLPKWEEAKELVKKLALIVPSNRYSSWDIALTEQGWVMIEVNAKGQFVWQYATKEGFRDEIESILKEIKSCKNN